MGPCRLGLQGDLQATLRVLTWSAADLKCQHIYFEACFLSERRCFREHYFMLIFRRRSVARCETLRVETLVQVLPDSGENERAQGSTAESRLVI